MNNERGEATLFCILILVALSSLLTLAGLDLQRNFGLLKKRTHLFLCVKETKGELNKYMTSMGRTNWVLKNTSRAQAVAVFIPVLWPSIGNAEKIKKVMKSYQAMQLGLYHKTLVNLKNRGCPLDPQMFLNPYVPGGDYGFSRNMDASAKLRTKKWTYYFLDRPYLLTLVVDGTRAESLIPKLDYRAEEKMGTLSSLLSSR